MMPAYILIDLLSVTDPAEFGAYQPLASAAVESFRGRYVLPHDTLIEALEGNWTPSRVVVLEFDDAEAARAWWESVEYAEARALHRRATIANVILVGGAPHAPECFETEVTVG
jgi:uncharacterized protein (DUF1330 family)